MKRVIRIVLIGIVLAIAVFGVIATALAEPGGQRVALAQTGPTATPAATASPTARPGATTTPSTNASNIGDTFWQGLAAKSGVSVDTLKSQALQVRKDMIDQAVKDGRLTQDRASQIKQNLNANDLIAPINIGPANAHPGNQPRGNRGNRQNPNLGNRGFMHGFRIGSSTAELEAVAKALNMTPSDMVTQLRGGKTLADLAAAQNVDQVKVKQAIIDTRKAEIDRRVADGLITQAQADQLKANLTPDKIDLTHPGLFRRSK